jgi:HEAT repeat protein
MLSAVLEVAHANVDFNQDELRWKAVMALRRFHQQRAIDELKALSQDKSKRVREAAEKLLRQRASQDGTRNGDAAHF